MTSDARQPGTALAIRHLHFEDLGVFEPVLAAAGYEVCYHDVGVDGLDGLDPLSADLLVVLGGPIGVNDLETYPFIEDELQLIEARLAAGLPTLGLCLGAQLIARVLGGSVAAMGRKEIGFSALTLSEAGRAGPLQHLEGVPVLHWHGDAIDLPQDWPSLASTALCAGQAFAIGQNVLCLQFHAEFDAVRIESWLIGHAAELAQAGIDPRDLRQQAQTLGPGLGEAGARMLNAWLGGLDARA